MHIALLKLVTSTICLRPCCTMSGADLANGATRETRAKRLSPAQSSSRTPGSWRGTKGSGSQGSSSSATRSMRCRCSTATGATR
eukprot:2753857-Rhodomonas_salina.3